MHVIDRYAWIQLDDERRAPTPFLSRWMTEKKKRSIKRTTHDATSV